MTDPGFAPPALEATGERLVPEAFAGELVLAEDVARYALATRLAAGRRVLDAACGEGYGTAMLAEAGATSVVGIDADAATVEHARRRYGVDARVCRVEELALDAGDVDLVVSFETIEHGGEPERGLDEFARVLATDGLLLISTLNATEYLEDNPFHVRELASAEFLAELRARVALVRPLYQQSFLSSAILDDRALRLADHDVALEIEARKTVAAEPGAELSTLALRVQDRSRSLTPTSWAWRASTRPTSWRRACGTPSAASASGTNAQRMASASGPSGGHVRRRPSGCARRGRCALRPPRTTSGPGRSAPRRQRGR